MCWKECKIMGFGNINKEDLANICKDINEEIILQGLKYIDIHGIPSRRGAKSHFILFNEKKYPLKYVLEVANNIILKNHIKIGPNTKYIPDSWCVFDVIQELIPFPENIELLTYYNDNDNDKNISNKNFQESISVQEYFLQQINNNGLTIRTYKDLSERTVQQNGKVKCYFVLLKHGNLKLCLRNFQIPDVTNINGIEVIPYQDTYPKLYPQRIYFKFCKLSDAKDVIDVILKQILNQNLMKEEKSQKGESMSNNNTSTSQPLNQILYGPPGTGKTYNTVVKAMEIIGLDNDKPQKSKLTNEQYDILKNKINNTNNEQYDDDEYTELKAQFDEAKKEHQIEFITFHQSYSYEEFVEGIKPDMNEDWETPTEKLNYVGKDGVFKRLCDNAKQIRNNQSSNEIDFTKTRIFKMSLGDTTKKETDIFDYCIENNVVSLGFKNVDFSACNERADFEKLDDTWGAKALEIFKLWMRKGDIILISNGNKNIRAIAKITDDYLFNPDASIPYSHFRSVEWLYNGENIPINKLYNKNLSQQSIYAFYNEKILNKENYNGNINTQFINKIITGEINENEIKPHVLIIDEINRGNISKIFGELITLIEEDKRENLTVTLPYSQQLFTVPKNLYIIGTMNTADKSLALLDVALRRRFDFVAMYPKYAGEIKYEDVRMSDFLKNLNNSILEKKKSADYMIGHSYFMNDTFEKLPDILNKKVIPLLMEYFNGKVDIVKEILLKTNGNLQINENYYRLEVESVGEKEQ